MVILLVIADVLMAAAFLLRLNTLPPQIPLLYSQPWGEDQLVDFWLIALLPILLHLFFFLNIFVYTKFFFPDYLIRRIIVITNVALIIVFTSIFIRIVFYVT
jgi:hypothetical protein